MKFKENDLETKKSFKKNNRISNKIINMKLKRY